MKFTKLSISLLLASILFSCANSTEQKADSITVSILPQKYFVEALIGQTNPVNVLIPPGASPASYEPTPKQIKELSNSKLYLTVGHLGFEKAWLEKMEKNHPNLKIVDTSVGIDLISDEHEDDEGEQADAHQDHQHHGIDPHIWMSPKQAYQMVNNMANALIRHDNACQDLINHNRDSLLTAIAHLDTIFTEGLSPVVNRKFIIFHPALSYLARDYNLEQIAMEFQGKEPSAAHLKSIVDRARSENIQILFIQKEFDKENATQLAKEINAQLIQIDPLAENWFEQMNDILQKLTKQHAG